MSAHADIPELDSAGLRKFALTTAAIVAVLFGVVLPWVLGFGVPLWPWILAAVLALWGVTAPSTLRPVYRGWMRFGLIMNRIMTPLILGMVFYCVITPIALIMKIKGRDTMNRALDEGAESYRVPSNKQPKEKMEKPF